jgi:hypothetical protein
MACPNFKNGPKNGLGPLGNKDTGLSITWYLRIEIVFHDQKKERNNVSYMPNLK